MPEENWQKVREIVDSALSRPRAQRESFVAKACGNDAVLLSEINSLLVSLDSADDFLETPAIEKVADEFLTGAGKLEKGQHLRHYRIVRELGSGGMGDVYLATDTKLNRPVALKILRPDLLSDNHANGRLLREAQAAAILDHPHICPIHEISETVDGSFIVMQYVEGETLADVLTKRPSARKSLDLAIQIVDALTEAHSHHIIHRDIKPANIIVNEKGQAKVLDFGLAKFVETESDTETAKAAHSSGALMGTVPYMSPEQLRGKRLDARTDIFSFGAMFYEMLSGEQAFGKESSAETAAAILTEQPDMSPIPRELQPILRKSLLKDRDLRYQSASDLAEDLRKLQKSGSLNAVSPTISTLPTLPVVTNDPAHPKSRQSFFWQSSKENVPNNNTGETERIQTAPIGGAWYMRASVPLAVLILSMLGIVVFLFWQIRKNDDLHSFDNLRSVRLVSWKTAAASNSTDFRLSHDGKMLAFSSTQQGGGEGIYIKQTSGGADHKVTDDSWRNVSPLWSPDDQQIAFVSLRQDQSGIYVSQTLGGAVTALKVTEESNISLRYWSRDAAAIYYEQAGNLYRLDLGTRTSEKITQFEDSRGYDRYFSFSPDEAHLAFRDRRDGQNDIWTMRIGGAEPIRLTDDPENELRPMWHPDGKRILYNVSRNDFYQIDLTSTDGGTPVQVTRGEGNHVLIDITGDRIYYAGAEKKSDIGSVDLDSLRESEVATGTEVEFWPDASPDGKWIVYHANASPNPTKRISESSLVLKSSDGQRVHLPGKGYDARWLPNSRHLAVLRLSESSPDGFDLWLIDTVSGVETRMTDESIMPVAYQPMPITRWNIGVFDFSPDSKRFVYLDKQKPQNAKIGSVESREFTSLTQNDNQNVGYLSARFSPDGTRVALVSLEQFQDKQQKPLSKVQVWEEAGLSEVFSTTDNLRLLGWSAAGEVILATTKGSMTASPIDVDIVAVLVRRPVRKLFTLQGVYAVTLTMSPDGKMLAYTAPREDRDDIWTVSLKGNGSPRKITANSTTRLFLVNPTFSHDGKLYFDKQEEVNSISMFENFN